MKLLPLHTSGNLIRDINGKTITLRGVSVADPGSLMFFRRGRPHDLFKIMELAVKEWGADIIRLPVHPDGIDDVPGFEGDIEKYFKKYIVPAVDKAAELGVYAIVDLHLIQDYGTKDEDALVREFWSIAAPYYKDTPGVLFELFNEPINPDSWDAWKLRAQPWVDMIRTLAPENIILAGGPRWCQNMAGAAANPLAGKNIVYSAHCYPSHFGDFEKNWGPLFERHPVFFTEWGYEKPGTYPWEGTTSVFGKPFLDKIETLGCSWCAWCFDNDWGPRVFDKPWSLPKDAENRMGMFLKEILNKKNSTNY